MMYSTCRASFSVFLVFLVATSAFAQNCLMRGGCRKTQESNRKIDFHLCGDQIFPAFNHVCKLDRRRKRAAATAVNILMDKRASAKFLSRHKRSYHIVEECCNEGCSFEEVHEYCGLVVQ